MYIHLPVATKTSRKPWKHREPNKPVKPLKPLQSKKPHSSISKPWNTQGEPLQPAASRPFKKETIQSFPCAKNIYIFAKGSKSNAKHTRFHFRK